LGVSRQGEFKNTIKKKKTVKKDHVENFFQKIDKNFSLSSNFLIAFSGVPQRWELKTHKKRCEKNIVSKRQKIRPKIQNRFFLDFVYRVFGHFSVRGVKKKPDKNIEK
jgi:hypothetical protein